MIQKAPSNFCRLTAWSAPNAEIAGSGGRTVRVSVGEPDIGPAGNAEGGKALDGGSDALHLGERAEWYRVHVVQDDPLHASERSLAIVRVRQPVHVVPRGQQIWVALVV